MSRSRRTLEQWSGLGSIAYVALFIGGGALMFGGEPDFDAPPAEVISFYGDSGNRDEIALGWGLILLGVFFFLWFLGALRQAVKRMDGDGLLTTLVTVGGAVYAATTLTGVSLEAGIKTMSDDTYNDQVYPALIHAAKDAGYVIFAGGGIGIGTMMIAASLAALGAGLIPRWTGVLGMLFGALALFSIFFVPLFLIAIWLVVAGFLLFRFRPAATDARVAP